MSLDVKTSLAFALCTGLSVSASAEIYLNEQFENWPFTDGRSPEWFINAGNSDAYFGNPDTDATFGSEAKYFRYQPSGNQNAHMFAVQLSSTATISQSTGISISFDYRDNNANAPLNRLIFGLFDGDPVTANGYKKFQADGNASLSEPTEDWSGYVANVTTNAGRDYQVEYDSGTNDTVDSPLEGNTVIGAKVTNSSDLTLTSRTAELRLWVDADGNVELELYDNAIGDSATLIMSRTHTGAEQTTSFDNVMFRLAYASSGSQFGNTSFDNIVVESFAVPEPSTMILTVAGVLAIVLPGRWRQPA